MSQVTLNAVIESSARCMRCDYNLTGLTSPRCPECGTPFDFISRPTAGVRLEHLLLLINFFAIVLSGLLVGFSSKSASPRNIVEGEYVWAMLAPLQWVIAVAGIIIGGHLLKKSRRSWRVAIGIALPTLAAIFSLIRVF